MNPRNLFAELKRRNVYKVAVAYAIVGWLLVQVATQVFPIFEIPNWALRLIVLAIVIGFPIALVLAWAFELTPEGIKRTEEADLAGRTRPKSHAWIYVVVIGAAISTALFFLGRYTATNTASVVRTEAAAASSIPQKSIAVLPFDNLSRDPENAYFAEGIQDEILTRLAKINDLKVIGRSSTRRFKSGSEDVSGIAKQLGVAHLLEGSVQKATDRVRVNVQLINASNSVHLWAETYDRSITDVFAVESEVAKTIAEKLAAKLTGKEQQAISSRPTDNPAAHELYLKGRFFWNKRTGDDLKRAAEYFSQATVADPNYALAYAGLADAYVLMPNLGAGTPWESFRKAEAAARKALQLDEDVAEAHTSLGCVLVYYHLDFAQANTEYKRAIALNPNYATAHQWYADTVLTSLSRFDEAIGEFKRAFELDPLSLIVHTDLANTYRCARRTQDGLDILHRALEIDPNFYYAHRNRGLLFAAEREYEKAITEYEKARAISEDSRILALIAHAYGLSGNKAEPAQTLEQLKARSQQRYVSAFSFCLVYLGLGDKEKALDSLEQSFRDRAGSDIAKMKVDPLLDSLRGEPRFEALVEKVLAEAPRANPP
jgi:TolB-like protein/Tfp pilus assembly protein PilF